MQSCTVPHMYVHMQVKVTNYTLTKQPDYSTNVFQVQFRKCFSRISIHTTCVIPAYSRMHCKRTCIPSINDRVHCSTVELCI